MNNDDATAKWWAHRAAEIAQVMSKTGVCELIIRRNQNGKYTFELTPECAGCGGTGKYSTETMARYGDDPIPCPDCSLHNH